MYRKGEKETEKQGNRGTEEQHEHWPARGLDRKGDREGDREGDRKGDRKEGRKEDRKEDR